MDMCLLLISLEAIECICTYEKAKLDSSEKASKKGKTGEEHPSTDSTARVPKKVHLQPVQEAWGRVYHAQYL